VGRARRSGESPERHQSLIKKQQKKNRIVITSSVPTTTADRIVGRSDVQSELLEARLGAGSCAVHRPALPSGWARRAPPLAVAGRDQPLLQPVVCP
jgi:hypothetical protein